MDVGLFAPTATPAATRDLLAALGPAAEARGFASLWVPEHVVTFDPASSPTRGPAPTPAGENGSLDPFTALAFLAATTSRIRLGTGVALVSQRQPLFTAKEVASVDHLSGGRLDLGVGVGWIRGEFTALGLRREDRGRLADRNLAVMRTLWTDAVSEYHGDGIDLAPCRAYPKPVQRPHPPIHVGGHSDAALERVARVGQGWYVFGVDVATFADRLAVLDRVLEDHGRTRAEIRVSVCPFRHPSDADAVRRYRDAGADQVILPDAATLDDNTLLPRLDQLARIVDAVRA